MANPGGFVTVVGLLEKGTTYLMINSNVVGAVRVNVIEPLSLSPECWRFVNVGVEEDVSTVNPLEEEEEELGRSASTQAVTATAIMIRITSPTVKEDAPVDISSFYCWFVNETEYCAVKSVTGFVKLIVSEKVLLTPN